MSSFQEIEQAVRQLSEAELRQFRAWFAEHDAGEWDAQFERDVAEDCLDSLAEEALGELEKGECTER